MKRFLLILFFICSFSAVADNPERETPALKTLAGRITDQTGNTVSGISITVIETGAVYFADFDGQFALPLNTDKTYTLRVSSLGFAPLEVKSSHLGLFSDLILQTID